MTHTRHLAACFAFAIATLLAFTPGAAAQTTPIDEQFVVVTRPESNPAQLRCFAGQIWYPVDFLKEGQVLKADAVRDDWYRVGYPAGVPAVVTLGEARFDATSNTITLTDASALQARNFSRPTSIESYKEVFDPRLPAGTVLSVAGEMLEGDTLTGYFVLPPEGAKGWVNRRHVRDATQTEIDTFNASMRPSEPDSTPMTPPASEPEAELPATEDDANHAAPGNAPIEMTPIDPAPLNVVPPHAEESEPVTEPEQAEATAPDAEVDESAADTEPEEPALTPEQNRAALYAKLADLDASYDAISDQQTEGAEITPLRTEYSTLRDEARSITDDAGMVRLAEYADARIALLSLRAEVQIARTQLAELEEQADANRSAIQSTREGIMRARGYEMVGVLTRSSLYTGGALPLRFRLQSSSSVIARTIAYIEPKEGTDLAPLLGKQVGVIVALDGVTRTGPVPILRAEVVESVNLDEPAGNR